MSCLRGLPRIDLIGEYGLIRNVKRINGPAAINAMTSRVANNGRIKAMFPVMIWRNFRLCTGYFFEITFSVNTMSTAT
jgi:hypothetical protein